MSAYVFSILGHIDAYWSPSKVDSSTYYHQTFSCKLKSLVGYDLIHCFLSALFFNRSLCDLLILLVNKFITQISMRCWLLNTEYLYNFFYTRYKALDEYVCKVYSSTGVHLILESSAKICREKYKLNTSA